MQFSFYNIVVDISHLLPDYRYIYLSALLTPRAASVALAAAPVTITIVLPYQRLVACLPVCLFADGFTCCHCFLAAVVIVTSRLVAVAAVTE